MLIVRSLQSHTQEDRSKMVPCLPVLIVVIIILITVVPLALPGALVVYGVMLASET